jgi:hypothetical protein
MLSTPGKRRWEVHTTPYEPPGLEVIFNLMINGHDQYQRAVSLLNSHVSNRHLYTVSARCNFAAGHIACTCVVILLFLYLRY